MIKPRFALAHYSVPVMDVFGRTPCVQCNVTKYVSTERTAHIKDARAYTYVSSTVHKVSDKSDLLKGYGNLKTP
jgi:hypothetical protein